MTDLTTYEYYSVPEEELWETLQEEARKMFASDSLEYDFRESVDDFSSSFPAQRQRNNFN
ncbi:hypothetical protein ACFL0H_09000 [Thermodesulfobacteriota bacterium]